MAYIQLANARLKDNIIINQKIDNQLSIDSINPVENGVITSALNGLSDEIEANIIRYTEFEVFPTNQPILSGTVDSLEDLKTKGIIDDHEVDQSAHIFTGLKYNVQVDPQMTHIIELYSNVSQQNNDVSIDWGDGTIDIIHDMVAIDPDSLLDVDDQKSIEGSSGLLCYNYAPQIASYFIALTHTYAIPAKYFVKITGKDYNTIRFRDSNLGGSDNYTGITSVNIQYNTTRYNLVSNIFLAGGSKLLPIAYHVTNCASMLKCANRLLALNINGFNNKIYNFANFANSSSNLQSVFVQENFFTSTSYNAYYFNHMFSYCNSLKYVHLALPSSWRRYRDQLFYSCPLLPESIQNGSAFGIDAENESTGTIIIDSNFYKIAKSIVDPVEEKVENIELSVISTIVPQIQEVSSSVSMVSSSIEDVIISTETINETLESSNVVYPFGNLADLSLVNQGKYINGGGGWSANSTSYYINQYIPVDPAKTYLMTPGSYFIGLYDENKVATGSKRIVTSGKTDTFNFGEDVRYIIVSTYQRPLSKNFCIVESTENYSDNISEEMGLVDGFNTCLVYPIKKEYLTKGDCTSVEQNSYTDSASKIISESYDTFNYIALNDFDFWFDYVPTKDTMVEVESEDGSNAIARHRNDSSHGTIGTLPTESSKLHIFKGQTLKVGVVATSPSNFKIHTSGAIVEYAFNRKIKSKANAPIKNNVTYVHRVGDGGYPRDALVMTFKQTNGYVKYALNRVNGYNKSIGENTKKYDLWRIRSIYHYDDDFDIRYPLTHGGEMEIAITLSGDPTFIGGENHGHETLKDFHVFVDGKHINDLSDWNGCEFTKLKIIESTSLSSIATDQEVAVNNRIYDFDEHGNLTLNQCLDWKADVGINTLYMGMCQMPYTYSYNDPFTGESVVSTLINNLYTDIDYAVKSAPPLSDTDSLHGCTKVTGFSNACGLTYNFEIKKNPDFNDNYIVYTSNSGDNMKKYYNKIGCTSVLSGDRINTSTCVAFECNDK